MPDSSNPSEADLAAFLEKLADFHETLTPPEQGLLDRMTLAAIRHDDAEVAGFMNFGTPGMADMFQGLSARKYYANIAGMLNQG